MFRGAQATIEREHDNPERFREMGVEVFFGTDILTRHLRLLLKMWKTEKRLPSTAKNL